MRIPLVDLGLQHKNLSKEINKTLKEILSLSAFIKGSFLEKFENDFAKFVNAKYCIGVASGTDALHLSFRALDIGPGDEVILPVNTFIATVYAVLYVGAKPIFVDVSPQTLNIDTEEIENKISKKTKAIIPVHLYGQPAEMDKINFLAKKYSLAVIEDACQAHGAFYKKKRAGNLGTLAAFSFYPSKNIGGWGDGGAITTNLRKLTQRLRNLREYGGSKYFYDEIGYNSRLDAIHAAILGIKLKHLDRWNAKRQKLADYYTKMIEEKIPTIVTPTVKNNATSVFYVYVIRTQKRDQLVKYLESHGIQTGTHYPRPLHLQKSLKFLEYKKGDFPVAEKAAHELLSLPMYPELTKTQQEYIIRTIKRFHEKN